MAGGVKLLVSTLAVFSVIRLNTVMYFDNSPDICEMRLLKVNF